MIANEAEGLSRAHGEADLVHKRKPVRQPVETDRQAVNDEYRFFGLGLRCSRHDDYMSGHGVSFKPILV
jgi:hypothetical protein